MPVQIGAPDCFKNRFRCSSLLHRPSNQTVPQAQLGYYLAGLLEGDGHI